ncbi:hypothetical protein H3S75_05315 [Gilliamella sp. B14384G15]|uniref:hypothetical protein n=1 Tax=unclassified Gilliamella TaxID=2685620 RepID=UPI0018DD80F6|nr:MULTISPECIES: hypothetical protein [unclassified Gilliamella]MBI0030646.1 hypothetical protein [Gilliamella sp. B14384G15]MBI0057942.1 hypothetical protein [Gilliamella sp. B14384G12]
MLHRVNHCPLGQHHMLDKIAYDYVTKIKTRGANKSKIKHELAERVKKFTDKDKEKLRELIQKWQELKK